MTAGRPASRRRTVRLPSVVTALVAAALVVVGAPPASAAPGDVTLVGAGWGHGVGLSQYGAREQAVDGRSAEQILAHYYTGTSTQWATDNQVVRVQLVSTAGSLTARTRQVGSSGGDFTVAAGATVIAGRLGDTVTFARGGAGITATVRRADGSTANLSGASVGLRWAGTRELGGAATVVEVPGANAGATGVYRHGRLEVRNVGGRVNVVNLVRFHDEYLNGIAEMPSSWPREALRAQAIAARTYGLRNSAGGVRAACDCHLYDEVTHQKFTGWAKEGEPTWGSRWVDAVRSTAEPGNPSRGKVVTHSGALIDAFYFSSSGGRTQNSEDAFTAALPYARSVDDGWSLRAGNPNRRWQVTTTNAAVAGAFGLPDVARLDLSSRTAADAVRVATAWSSSGRSASLSGPALRSRLGLKAAWLRRDTARYAGTTRYATAVEIGRSSSPTGRTVVLVNGADAHLVDGMVAAPLARALGAPLLLTDAGTLPAATEAELRRRAATRAVVVGSDGVVGSGVVDRLRSMGITVERVFGDDRYGTAAAVARKVGAAGGAAVFANGADASLADVAAAGGPAAATRRPLLLVEKDRVPAPTAAAIRDLAVRSGTCVGSPGVLSEQVRTSLPSCARAGGPDRYATAAAVLSTFRGLVDQSSVIVAPGQQSGLVDTVTAGTFGRLVLLVDGRRVPAPTVEALQRTLGAGRLAAVGGPTVVPDQAVAQLARS